MIGAILFEILKFRHLNLSMIRLNRSVFHIGKNTGVKTKYTETKGRFLPTG
jgi:hypothetical protein